MLRPEHFYLLRTPYLPVLYAERLLDNPEKTQEILTELFAAQDLKQALFLASPVLFNELERYLLPNVNKEVDKKRVEQSLLKYIIRASCRSTPYGMFSGVSLGLLSDHTNIVLTDRDKHIAITRLDMQLLETIVENLVSITEVRCKLKFYPNSSAYVINHKLNYFESRMIGRTKAFNLSSVEYTDHLHKVIEYSKCGATQEQLRTCFNLNEFEVHEVDSFINELIDNQVLVHNIFPSLTCDNTIEDIIKKLEKLNNPVTNTLFDVCNSLSRIQNIVEGHDDILIKKKRVESEIENSFGIENYDGDFFQVDLKLSHIDNRIDKSIIEEITLQAEELASIMPNSVVEDLENFKIKYDRRYEKRKMPLTDVLDLEYGIGYGDVGNHMVGTSELIGGITNFKSGSSQLLKLDALQNLQHHKLYDALQRGLSEIIITEKDIESIKRQNVKSPVLPDSCYIMGSIIFSNCDDASDGSYKFKLDYFNGPSATTLLARFCHTDTDLINHLKTAIKHEEIHKDAIYAEIVHSPQPRLGNVIHRPILREYEIPYLSESGIDKEKCIDVGDLMISIHNGDIVLRSKKLNKRVIPCLSSAQNFRFASLPTYKFLCDLQHQGIMASFVWNWGGFQTAKFLPRVVYKKIIITPAIWNFNTEILKEYLKDNQSKNLIWALQAFRKEYNIPAKVLLADGDNKLLIDLDNKTCLEILFKALQNKTIITLTEAFFPTKNCLVKDFERRGYAHEIIIPISKSLNNQGKIAFPELSSAEEIERKYHVGSEWIYAKIYGGHMTLDTVLKTKLSKVLTIMEENKVIDKWFFIRYNDPDNHIRLRMHLKNEDFATEVIKYLNDILEEEISDDTVYKISYEAYDRELERYGTHMMGYCETIFWRDSEAIITMMNCQSENGMSTNSRWLFALQSMDEYFNYFKISMKERIQFTEMLADNFCREFGEIKILHHDLNNLYRENRDLIEKHFNGETAEVHTLGNILDKRGKELYYVVKKIIQHYSAQNKGGTQISILSSIIHMSINRLFPVYQRKYEMILYYFLNKHYKKIYYSNLT